MVKQQSAFTLFEVLVALAILSITMVAAIVTSDSVIDRTIYLEKKVLAHWVGINMLNSMQLKLTKDKIEPATDISGKTTMRSQEFEYHIKINQEQLSDTPLYNIQVVIKETVSNPSKHDNQENKILDTVSRMVPLSRN